MRQFDSFFQHAKRYKEILSVAIIDIDKLKSINDTYGHAAGDTVLRELARHVNASLRHTDTAGRYGGEEFVLLFPQTSAESASFSATDQSSNNWRRANLTFDHDSPTTASRPETQRRFGFLRSLH